MRYTGFVSRIAIGIVAGVLAISALMAGTYIGLALIAAVFVFASSEFIGLMNPQAEKHISSALKFVFAAAFVTCIVQLAIFAPRSEDAFAAAAFFIFTATLAYMLVFFAAAYLTVSNYPDGGFSLQQALYVYFGFGYLFAGMASFAMVYALGGDYLWFLVCILSWGMDAGAFFTGRLFGKTPLAPKVSPKKTKEGLFGGMLAAAFATPWFFYIIAPLDARPDTVQLLGYAFMGAFIAGFGHLGDLMMSVIKRRSERKESGKFIPEHGGVLDKLDSFLPVSIAVAAFFIYGFVSR